MVIGVIIAIGSIITKEKSKKITDLIIQHLLTKQDHKDDLEGISLFVYENELNELAGQIVVAVRNLIAKGMIKESESLSGKNQYQLSNDHSL